MSTVAKTIRRGRVDTVTALVTHARDVLSVRREQFADELRKRDDGPGRIVIRTCHRVELYSVGPHLDAEPLPDVPPGGRRLGQAAAVRHLISVACGLDSAVFGETQILHQLRETIADRRGERALDPALDRLFQVALRAGRVAHGLLSGPPRSLADAALDRISGFGGPLEGRSILVVGAGRMGRLAAFAAHRRAAHVLVANRSADRARSLAAEVGGQAVPFDSAGNLPVLAGVVVAINGTWLLDGPELGGLRDAGSVIVDLSSPPAVSPTARAIIGARLITVDDLAAAIEDPQFERIRGRLQELVSQAGTDYARWLQARQAVPAIRAVVESTEAQRRTELALLRQRRPGLGAEDVAAIEQMTHRLVATILHHPLAALNDDPSGDLERATRRLFDV